MALQIPVPIPRPAGLQPLPQVAPTEVLENFIMRKYTWGPNSIIRAKEEITLYERSFYGFLVFVYLRTDNPDLSVVLNLLGDGMIDLVISPRMLYEDGLVQPSASAGWVARYDTSNNIYVAMYTPSPWIPWSGLVRIKLANPTLIDSRYTIIAWALERRR